MVRICRIQNSILKIISNLSVISRPVEIDRNLLFYSHLERRPILRVPHHCCSRISHHHHRRIRRRRPISVVDRIALGILVVHLPILSSVTSRVLILDYLIVTSRSLVLLQSFVVNRVSAQILLLYLDRTVLRVFRRHRMVDLRVADRVLFIRRRLWLTLDV